MSLRGNPHDGGNNEERSREESAPIPNPISEEARRKREQEVHRHREGDQDSKEGRTLPEGDNVEVEEQGIDGDAETTGKREQDVQARVAPKGMQG